MKAAICVAWADGIMKDVERKALDGVILAAELSPDELAEVRAYAAQPHTMADLNALNIGGWPAPDRRVALTQAVAIAYADRNWEFAERQTIVALAERLGISSAEAHQIIANATSRADRMAR